MAGDSSDDVERSSASTEEAAPGEPAGQGSAEEASGELAGEATADEAAPAANPPPAAAAPPPVHRRVLGRVEGWYEWIKEHYCKLDPRTAGIFRILIGFLAAAHAARHWQVAQRFYSNEGVLTNHYHLFKPSSGYNFSIFHSFSTLGEVHVAFALAMICHLLMMVGYRARLFTFLSFIVVTSLDNRLVMVENGGYVVVNLSLFYASFLPVDRRFSVDALLRSFRERRERTALDLNERYRPGWAVDPFVSIASLLVVLNFAVIYFLNIVSKSGVIWRRGDTVHYVLHINRMITGLAVVARDVLPLWVTRLMTWGVIVLEGLLPAWIMAPYARRITRPLALGGVFALHMAFGTMMRLGPFSWFMIGWSTILLAPEQWEQLEAWHRRRAAPRVVVYDRGSPLAFALMRLLSRLDGMELLTFEESAVDDPSPELVLARDPNDPSRTFVGKNALREIARALPGGRFWFPAVQVLSLGLFGAIFAAASRRREGVARFFGLTTPPDGEPRIDAPTPVGRSIDWVLVRTREIALVFFGLCSVFQAIDENKAVPPWAKPNKPKFIDAMLSYPRLYQGWGMFAPNPITDDGSVSVDARTIDGRRVDPFTGEEPDLDISDARGLGLVQIQQDYFNRIRLDRNKVFRQGLQEYLRRWHLETGRPEDELVAFDVYWVRAQCPEPGKNKAFKNEALAILTWRKPGYRAPPELPPIPAEPKVESAESSKVPLPLSDPGHK